MPADKSFGNNADESALAKNSTARNVTAENVGESSAAKKVAIETAGKNTTVGNTPVVDISQLSPNPNVKFKLKLEEYNPTGSIKDRIAKGMIEDAEQNGRLKTNSTILEPSSGNTGIALASICRAKGYNLKVVIPENVSVERIQILNAFGAEIIFSPSEEGSNGAVRKAEGIAAENPEWVYLCQYENNANPKTHYQTTGPEIYSACPEMTHFIAGLGTTGTLMGVGKYLKEQNTDIQIIAIEPPTGETVEGLRSLDDGYVPPIFEKWSGDKLLNGRRIVRPKESILATRELAKQAGLLVGISTGAALAGAILEAERLDGAGEIVIISADGGWKYLSTGAWTDPVDEVVERAKKIIYF